MLSYKRPRDEEEDDDELPEYHNEHKRLRALPFRDSPTAPYSTLSFSIRHISKPPSLTPADESSSEDSSPEPIVASPSYPPRPTLPAFVSTDVDGEMDYAMADAEGPDLSSPIWSPKTPLHTLLGPSPGASLASPTLPQLLSVPSPHDAIQTARIPTPIFGKFSTRARPSAFVGAANSLSPIPAPGLAAPELIANDPLRRRRLLPSPISEDTISPSTTTLMRDLDMSSTPAATTATAFPSDILSPLSPVLTRRHDSGGSCSSTRSGSGSEGGGRRRSDAISGGENGSKVIFSMGFRADCDKCREKVPGHYSHVLRV